MGATRAPRPRLGAVARPSVGIRRRGPRNHPSAICRCAGKAWPGSGTFQSACGCLRSQEKQALKIVRFQRHLPLTIQFYISCRISGVPPLQSDFSGLSSALKDDTIEPKKRKETRTKPTKMARKKSTLRMTRTTTDKLPTCDYYYKLARRLPAPSPGPALLSAAAGASVYLEPVHP